MLTFSFIALGLLFLGIGLYRLFAIQSMEAQNPPLADLRKPDAVPSTTYQLALEEAIQVALADGTLSRREENLLRDKAKLAGKDPDELITQLREDLLGLEDAETEIIDTRQRAGLDFEKYVVQKFNPNFFTINQWEGDKFVAGRYAETTLQPDIQLTLMLNGKEYPFAVECKWRSRTADEFIRFAEDHQLLRYEEFEKRTGKSTFIVLGVGGKPSAPQEVFIIPMGIFNKGVQHKGNLGRYKKRSLERDFFYDPKKGELW